MHHLSFFASYTWDQANKLRPSAKLLLLRCICQVHEHITSMQIQWTALSSLTASFFSLIHVGTKLASALCSDDYRLRGPPSEVGCLWVLLLVYFKQLCFKLPVVSVTCVSGRWHCCVSAQTYDIKLKRLTAEKLWQKRFFSVHILFWLQLGVGKFLLLQKKLQGWLTNSEVTLRQNRCKDTLLCQLSTDQ